MELRGFEPLTPSMRTRCATGLRHSPGNPENAADDTGPTTSVADRPLPVPLRDIGEVWVVVIDADQLLV